MTRPLRPAGVGGGAFAVQPGAVRPSGSDFASRLGAASPAGGAQALAATVGREVVKAALSGLPPVVSGLAQRAVSMATGGAVPAQDQGSLELIDTCRFYLLMNAIFSTANASKVEKDNS